MASVAPGIPILREPARTAAEALPRWLMPLLRAAALLLAAAAAVAGVLNESMNSDGISYLDIGAAYFRGDWWGALNATWSPLYPVIAGAAMRIFRPEMHAHFAVIHAVNFCIFIGALICFEFFLREASSRYYSAAGGTAVHRLPRWAFTCAVYALFIWSSTALIPVYAVTPDLLVAASLYLAAGLLLRYGREPRRLTAILLGLALGFGYLAKAAMFPLAFVFLALHLFQNLRRGTWPRALAAVAGFAVVAAPLVVGLSVKAGRPTFSDVGSFTYLKHVYRVPVPHYDAGHAPVRGEQLHPLVRIESTPPVYGFAAPVGGTYPLSYDPAFWYEGLQAPFNARLQFTAFAENIQYYFQLFLRLQGPVTAVVVLLLVASLLPVPRTGSSDGWMLVVTACAAFAMYSLVYVTGRYIGGFVVLFWTGLLMTVRVRGDVLHAAWLKRAGAVLVLFLGVNIVSFQLEGLNAMLGLVRGPPGLVSSTPPPSARPTVVATHLKELGLREGDRVGVLGYSYDAFWAWLLKVRIVAEVAPRDLDAFWNGTSEEQRAVQHAFRTLGVRAIVAEQVPDRVVLDGWTQLGTTRYYALLLE